MKTEQHTNETGEEKGEQGARAFSVFLHKVGDGDCHRELSQELHELAKTLLVQSQNQARAVRGSLTLTLNIAGEGGLLDVTYAISRKDPKPRRPRSTFWTAKDGNVVDENPKQLKLGVRDVSRAAKETREPAPAVTPLRNA